MPGGAEQSNNIKRQESRFGQFKLHLSEGCAGMQVQINAGEAQMPDVPSDVGKDYGASPALQGVHPIALPGITDDVSLSAIPDVETIEPVKGDRQPDAKGFQHDHQRQT